MAETALQVITGSDYLENQEAQLRAIGHYLAPVGMAAAAIGLVGWVLLFFITVRWFLLIVIVASLLALILPRTADTLEEEANNYAQGRKGEELLVAELRQQLDGDWTLFQNLLLPDGKGDIDAVLVGPKGVWALEVKTYKGTFRNRSFDWERRNDKSEWEALSYNPSRQARRNEERIKAYLSDTIGEMPLLNRIVWADANAVLLQENPAIEFWKLGEMGAVATDLGARDAHDETTVNAVKSKLALLSAESESSTKSGEQ